MKKINGTLILIGLLFTCSFSDSKNSNDRETTFTVDNGFISYIMKRCNPDNWGLEGDRFYPYSSPRGRLIGYQQKITDKTVYDVGWAKEDAIKQLVSTCKKIHKDQKKYVDKNYSETPYNSLSAKSQEILLDFALTNGIENLSDEFYKTVIAQDWQKFFDSNMYIRWVEKGWTDKIVNKAFADRWLDPEDRYAPWQIERMARHGLLKSKRTK